ncbi:NADH dehydrogenase [ubiquinone] 1 alpha subcomplex subunit 13-like [Artemia franciscana]|uniref:NADH dehydrogenase [ubiquinone] 1 alpha subcomplex subunit 13 n=1 Tax=Artemia franciscana TaxID=6661 RepID=A0AA88H8W7_ARTSF|nr:hypothetical protein QYM36_016707 [Artemia franciscana]
MPVTYKQDLPPPGGYEGIKVKRVPMRQYFTGYQIILGYIGITAASAWYYFQGKKRMNRDFVEMHSSHLAVLPMLVAEQDRAYLKHLRKIRDEESKLMANIPNWQVGKLYDEPVYKTLDKDDWIDLSLHEYYTHSRWWDKYSKEHFSDYL